MVSMAVAIDQILYYTYEMHLARTRGLSTKHNYTEVLSVPKARNRVLAEDVRATINVPSVRTSIMDGFAVCVEALSQTSTQNEPKEYVDFKVVERMYAGGTGGASASPQELQPGECVYVTTGAPVPRGTTVVIKVEDCCPCRELGVPYKADDSDIPEPSQASFIRSQASAAYATPGTFIREVGSDVSAGQIVAKRGQRISPALLATILSAGANQVVVTVPPRITVFSSGDELLTDETELGESSPMIRDSNRPMLLSMIHQEIEGSEATTRDGGIIRDTYDDLVNAINTAIQTSDVIITTGAVSMGARDLIKPYLGEIGKVVFGRIKMKPGKPTTFAVVPRPSQAHGEASQESCLFFALPGNPVSAYVTFLSLVLPALRLLTGFSVDALPAPELLPSIKSKLDQAMQSGNYNESAFSTSLQLPKVTAKLAHDIVIDPERDEYHRLVLTWTPGHNHKQQGEGGYFLAASTGGQASCRLLSVAGSNALGLIPSHLAVEHNMRVIPKDAWIDAWLTEPLNDVQLPAPTLKPGQRISTCGCGSKHEMESSHSSTESKVPSSSETNVRSAQDHHTSSSRIKVSLITVSDTRVPKTDLTGAEARKILESFQDPSPFEVIEARIVKDEQKEIVRCLQESSYRSPGPSRPDIILTMGGTGFGPRDVTPEATREVVGTRIATGIEHFVMKTSLKFTDMGALSRGTAGISNQTIIINLPGSPKAIKEILPALLGILPHAARLIRGSHEH